MLNSNWKGQELSKEGELFKSLQKIFSKTNGVGEKDMNKNYGPRVMNNRVKLTSKATAKNTVTHSTSSFFFDL